MKNGLIFILFILIMTQLVSAQNCTLTQPNNQLICDSVKDTSFIDTMKTYEQGNPNLFWLIAVILIIGFLILLNYMIENKKSDRILLILLEVALFILILFIITMLVVS